MTRLDIEPPAGGSGALAVRAPDRRPPRWYVRMVRRYIGVGPYLDFGCGTGGLLRRLAAHGSASGFEVFEYSAALSREAAPGCPVHTFLDEIPSGVFRGITAVHVLEHLDDDTARTVLACWRRVLVPGGRALIVVPDPAGKAHALAGAGWSGYRDLTRVNVKPHAEWRRFLLDAGFTVVREGSDGLWNGPYGVLPRAVPAQAQFLTGRLFLRSGSGESSVFVVEAPSALRPEHRRPPGR